MARVKGKGSDGNWPGRPVKGAMLRAFEAVMAGPPSEKDSELVKMVRAWRESDVAKFLAEYQKAEQQYAKRLEGWESQERERARERKAVSRSRERVEPDAGSVKIYEVIERLLRKEGIAVPLAGAGK